VTGRAAIAIVALLAALGPGGCASLPSGELPGALYGRWLLNTELTREAQPEGKASGGGLGGVGRPTVSVGGLPVPGTGGGGTPAIAGNARDPGVLRCEQLEIEPVGEEVRLTYVGVDSEQLKAGDDQGRVTRWTRDSLYSVYETTQRRVSQDYELRDDGRLLVTVKVNPNQGPTITTKRVFERPAEGGS